MTTEKLSREQKQEAALVEVEASRKDMETSKKRWIAAVLAARALNISNVRIAGRANVTETAIRLLVNRVESGKEQA